LGLGFLRRSRPRKLAAVAGARGCVVGPKAGSVRGFGQSRVRRWAAAGSASVCLDLGLPLPSMAGFGLDFTSCHLGFARWACRLCTACLAWLLPAATASACEEYSTRFSVDISRTHLHSGLWKWGRISLADRAGPYSGSGRARAMRIGSSTAKLPGARVTSS
jgi:hypothetical protein